jgi:hypothetical protein
MTFKVTLLMFQQMLIKYKLFYFNLQLVNQNFWFALEENNTNLFICILLVFE